MEANSSTLTDDQRTLAEHFRDLVGGMDFNDSVEILDNHSWNLEQAVNEFMGLTDTSYPRQRNVESGPSPTDHSPPNIDLSPAARMSVNASSITPQNESWLIWGFKWLISPATFTYRILSTISSFLISFVWPDPRSIVTDPVGDVRRFIEAFNEKYQNQSLPFFSGSYSEAFKDARQSLRYLIVYLHDDSNGNSDKFCKNTLSNAQVCRFLNVSSEYVFWACNVNSPEGYRVSRTLRASQFPFMGVVGLSNGNPEFLGSNRMALLGRIEGLLKPLDLVAQLKGMISNSSAVMQMARLERSELQANQRLRREQDAAYEESLAMDRAKREQKKAQEQAAREAQEKEDAIKNRQAQLERAAVTRSSFWSRHLPAEPSDGTNCVKLSIKMPNGQRFSRIFNTLHSTKALYYFALSQKDCPTNFKLQANFPKRFIECSPAVESDLEEYITEEEPERFQRPQLNTHDDSFWFPREGDAANFQEMQLVKPEIIFVLDEDA